MLLAIALGSAVLLASVGVGATWLTLRPRRPVDEQPREVLTTEQVAARSEASIAFVQGPGGAGTGFLVGDGLLATNAHVIASTPPGQIQVTFPAAPELDRGPLLGQVVYFDADRDLAILRVASRLQPLPVAAGHKFRRGQDVVVIGNPGVGGTALQCVVSRGVMGSEVVEDGRSIYQLSGSVNPGNSGGPALDLAGRVVGVVTARARKEEGLAFCVPPSDLSRAIREAAAQAPLAARAAVDRHVAAVAEAAREERLKAAMEKTQPATWIAMADADRELDDSSPEAVEARHALELADEFFAESPAAIVGMVFEVLAQARKVGAPVRGLDVLRGASSFAPQWYYYQARPVRFVEFARRYSRSHQRSSTHASTMAAVEESYRVDVARYRPEPDPGARRDPDPAPATRIAPVRSRPAAAIAPRPTEVKAPAATTPEGRSLELGRSLERQNKPRGALRYYRDLVDDHPGTPEAEEAARRISILAKPPIFRDRPPSRVLEVLDGRTVVVGLGGAKTQVRLLGLDPFPTNRLAGSRGNWEDQATAFLRDLLTGRAVFLDYEPRVSQSDGLGHTLAYLYRGDDLLAVNREVLARGYGVASKYGSFTQAEDFRDADARARVRKLGLWRP